MIASASAQATAIDREFVLPAPPLTRSREITPKRQLRLDEPDEGRDRAAAECSLRHEVLGNTRWIDTLPPS